MNKIKQLATTISDNRGTILKRTLIVSVSIVGVTLAAGFLKVKPSEEAVEVAEAVAEAVKKAAK